MRLKLVPNAGPETWVEWNPETGKLRGPAAVEVRELCASAMLAGSVTSHPHPTEYKIRDPFKNPSEMAVVLSTRWRVPDELAGDYPPFPKDEASAVLVDEQGNETPLPLVF